mmetsp:Transcript_2203/g.5073  ORF Transcript_2203/g.5073 Transcript_2203/m.5073 type:complete len:553 (-) Transcript_2203:477-2135(-)|eukprot:CAMPEP_0171497760 /NCGR_PEP_ID=MMETSP0958-20121227/7456_1 /TAXON_ID=87120 /ORGANISM="Aurantiochytrium limacinum, Strain ATCCMYA-1381" /LENGTH=552 /DNA_ID=CAMNT_0012032049 /DNA_START=247 /DNA_END=1905 /DNA_ORIENTATION=+
MASSSETLLRWLNSLIEESSDLPQLKDLDEILESDNSTFREIVEEITGVHGASENAAQVLERFFKDLGQPYIVDRGSSLSLSKAALGAAVNCDRKQDYVRSMMTLSQDFQATLMVLIEEFKREWDNGEATQLRAIMKRLERENAVLREAQADGKAQGSNATASQPAPSGGASAGEVSALQEKVRDLERKLKDAHNHAEEVEAELDETKQTLASSTREMDEKLSQFEEEVRAQADELDVARAKSAQLVKAEAKISKLMQKLEETSELRVQLKEIQEENQSNIDKQLRMDAEIKSVGTLKQQLETYKDKSVDLESRLVGLQNDLRTKDATIASQQSKLKAAADHEAFLKDQLNNSKEAIAQLETELEMNASDGAAGSGAASLANQVQAHAQQSATASTKLENAELKERVASLETSNKQLEEELEQARAKASADATLGASHEVVEQLKASLKDKESQVLQLSTDKEKLQNYVKQSLQATQSKYKVALKTLKSELDDKKETIQNFNKIRNEDTELAQREQRLIMSAFYEMGLSMQRNTALKSQNQGSWLAKTRQQV